MTSGALRSGLEAGRRPVRPDRYDPREPMGLPEPVQRYFRAALQPGQRMLAAAMLDHEGTFNMSERGEIMRFLAEAAWYPTALLPSQGVQWAPVDDRHAQATLADGGTQVSLTFGFGADGLIETVRAEDRGRTVAGRVVPTPWEGRWAHYAECDGMQVPLEGEVAWILPDGRKPYWRGRVTRLEYEHA